LERLRSLADPQALEDRLLASVDVEDPPADRLASLLLADLLASVDPQVSADRLASRAVVALPALVDVKDAELSHENQVTSPSLRKQDNSGKQHARRRTGTRTDGVRETVKRNLQSIETEHARIEKGAMQTVYQLSKSLSFWLLHM